MKPLFLKALLLLLATGAGLQAQPFDLTFNPASARRLTLTEPAPGSYDITVTGNDAFVSVNPFMPGPYNPDEIYVISFEYDAPAGLDFLEIFYGAVSPARKVTYEDLPATTGFATFKAFMKFDVDNWNSPFQAFRFDFSRTGRPSLSIRNIQLRAPTATEVIPLALNPAELNANATTVTDNGDGSFTIATSGADPWVASFPFTDAYDPAETYVLQYDYAGDALDDFRTFFGDPWSAARMAEFGPLPAAATPTTFTGFMSEGDPDWLGGPVSKLRFDFGRQPGKTITVSDFFLREPTFSELNDFEPPVVLETVPLEFNVNNTSGGLTATETAPREYTFATSGNDPWIRTKSVTDLYDIDSTYIIEFEYRAAEGYNVLEIFFGPPINASQLIDAGPLPAADEWTTFTVNPRLFLDNYQDANRTDFRFDFGKQENASKTIEVRNPVLRKPTAQERIDEQNSDKFVSRAVNLQFNQYRTRTYADKVTGVRVDADNVIVTGTVSGSGPYFLAEVDPEDYGFNLDTYDNLIPLTVSGGEFTVTQPRFVPLADRNKDRLYARWVVVTDDGDGTYTKTSPLAWATDIVRVAANNLPEDKAASVKGLDGLTAGTFSNFDDLIDLDIKSMKINLLLHGTLTLTPNGTGATHEFNGKTYFINQNFVDRLDQSIRACSENDIKPAVVLLIPISFPNNALQDSIWTHPDASLGLYSMANVTDARGVEYYTAAIDFLAQRYSRTDELYGRLDQWIIHNEVDAHTSWTHAGQKPAPLYTQIYDRSMRLVHYTLRKYNPTAKVFTSFTKHFASKVGGENGPNFRSKEILTTLNNQMKLEGDYEWGIGWHSYPTNLRNPAVWNDAISATPLNYNAAQITPRNLEVIDAYVRQENLLYNGKKVRTILLSENGFSSNVNTNPTFTQERQAAAVAYFWKKTDQRLPAVENIQYHRWVDNPNEGGLEFGLWTVEPGTVQGFGEKKPSWFVWEAAGTDREDAVFAPYLSTIGISDWSEIMFDFPSETTPYRVLMNIVNCDADLTDVLVSFNGEHKFPQPDGTVQFFNVASDVDQPLVIRKGDVILQSDVFTVSEDLELNFDLGTVTGLTATATSPTEVDLSWQGGAAGAEFIVERSVDGGAFAFLTRVGGTTYTDATVVSGQDYAYRVALVLSDDKTAGCFSDEVTVTAAFIIADYLNGDYNKPTNKKITPVLRLRNESDTPVALDELTVRYWFTNEAATELTLAVDEEISFADGITGTFVALDPALDGADYYLELSYATGYLIPANGATESMRTKISAFQRPDFDETDDYSYQNVRDFVETRTVTVYRNGELIWGDEPGAATPTAVMTTDREPATGPTAPAPDGTLTVYPNPARGTVSLTLPTDFEATALYLVDVNGRSVTVNLPTAGGRIQLGRRTPGVYLLRAVGTDGTVLGSKVLLR